MLPIILLRGEAGSGKDSIADVLVKDFGYNKIAQADPLKRFALNVLGVPTENLWGPSNMRNEPIRLTSRWDSNKVRVWAEREHISSAAQKPIDEVVQTVSQWIHSTLPKLNGADLTARTILQQFGTECGRNTLNRDIWVNKGLADAFEILNAHTYSSELGVYGKAGAPPEGIVISDGRFINEVLAVKKYGGRAVKVVPLNQPENKKLGASNAAHTSETEGGKIPNSWYDQIFFNNFADPSSLSSNHIFNALRP